MNHRLRLTRPRLGGAVYILPNLLTTGNLFFGFFSIIKSLQGDFSGAATAILLAAIFDVLDGQVARLTKGTSEFGVQYDSLCDLASFGLAPAVLMYQYALKDAGRLGWALCFIFLACGALRLARFNVQSAIGKTHGDSNGLPIPMPACLISCLLCLVADLQEWSQTGGPAWAAQLYLWTQEPALRQGVFLTLAPCLGILMVSNLAYRSNKSFTFRLMKPFKFLVLLVVILGLAAYKPAFFGFLFFLSYALSGPIEWVLGWKKATDDDEIFEPLDADSSVMEPSDDRVREWPSSEGTSRSMEPKL